MSTREKVACGVRTVGPQAGHQRHCTRWILHSFSQILSADGQSCGTPAVIGVLTHTLKATHPMGHVAEESRPCAHLHASFLGETG